MDIRRLSTAKSLPVRIEDIRTDLRVDSADEDDTIDRLARAAAMFIERRTGKVILPGDFEVLFDDWYELGCRPVWRAPLRDLQEVSYMSAANEWTDLNLDNFQLVRTEENFELAPFQGVRLTTPYVRRAGIRIRFEAGFDVESDPDSGGVSGEEYPLPDQYRTLLTMLVGHYYENRELFAADKLAEVEQSAGSLLAGFRQLW